MSVIKSAAIFLLGFPITQKIFEFFGPVAGISLYHRIGLGLSGGISFDS